MRVQEVAGGYVVKLERGEELIASLASLMRDRGIGSGAVTGLGAVSRARLGCYRVAGKDYVERAVEGDLEVVGLTGTMSWYDDEPFPHVHLMLTDVEFGATGGHCFEAWVSATIELYVTDWGKRVDRQMDDEVGLHLMNWDD
jgi:predicted DNA-binding protein with PD1-like motif